jgi:hypothetical protein
MTTSSHPLTRILAAMIMAALMLMEPALAASYGTKSSGAGAYITNVAYDCNEVGQALADSKGASLAAAYAETQNGVAVCRIVLLIPGSYGGRSQRKQFIVELN